MLLWQLTRKKPAPAKWHTHEHHLIVQTLGFFLCNVLPRLRQMVTGSADVGDYRPEDSIDTLYPLPITGLAD